ncbi:Leucine-rich repeat receptor-like protein kinase [Quillaja saponaria]|uniref:non-specific serine/threonine protein kinase n=1 Tax=Quillaja saponaria TaxID=32244 RepID=A0AAD7LZ61_QUISA|nr:Leucine-rich repeat receptor-like protein kinase [Quillaja saponaria]
MKNSMRFIVLQVLLLWLQFTACSSYSELNALLKLKADMKGPRGRGLEDWDDASSPLAYCSFSGVTCDEDLRVTALNLTFIPLFGFVSPDIGLLNKLVNLTLTQSNFTGNLRKETANLTSLKLLNISHNNFSGHFRGKITLVMMDLEILGAYDNNFTGPLPWEIANLKKLKQFDLGGNFFPVPASLAHLKNLEELYLVYYNAYEGDIPPELGYIASLQLLDMANCDLTGEIPASLSFLRNLYTLFLQMNHLTGRIPTEFSKSRTEWEAQGTRRHQKPPNRNASSGFVQRRKLKTMIAIANFFYGVIPQQLGECKSLSKIRLTKNYFTGSIPAGIFNLPLAIMIDLNGNYFSGELPLEISGDALGILKLSDNNFTGKITPAIGNLKSLHTLSLEMNKFSG